LDKKYNLLSHIVLHVEAKFSETYKFQGLVKKVEWENIASWMILKIKNFDDKTF